MIEQYLRPTKREIDKRIKEAQQAVAERRVLFANDRKLVGELMALRIGDTEELWPLIEDLLKELQLDYYDGKHPPESSYEPTIADCELWAFCWNSQRLMKRMYLKFAIKENCFYYVSLHESKFPEGKKL
jgi:hypothetical protein